MTPRGGVTAHPLAVDLRVAVPLNHGYFRMAFVRSRSVRNTHAFDSGGFTSLKIHLDVTHVKLDVKIMVLIAATHTPDA